MIGYSFDKCALAGTALLTCSAAATLGQPIPPAEEGDIAFGLFQGSSASTLEQIRGGAHLSNWISVPWIMSVEFDNLGGFSHNARGNLLGMEFGGADGAVLHSFATDGSNVSSIIYEFNGTHEAWTRGAGLSVSPDNEMIAMIGFDSFSLNILDYDPGDGTGNGWAELYVEVPFVSAWPAIQGTAWLNDEIVICALEGVVNGALEVATYNVQTGLFVPQFARGALGAGEMQTDVDYNPLISPYVWVVRSVYTATGTTRNLLFAFDPENWALPVDVVDLSGSCEQIREIALGVDRNKPALFLSAYGGNRAPSPWIDVLDISTVGSIADDSSRNYYRASVNSAFNGIDVALTEEPPCPIELTIDNLVAGEVATFTLTGGTPAQGGVTVYGLNAGVTLINDVAGYCAEFDIAGVNQNRVLGGLNKVFDGGGVLAFDVLIPDGTTGLTVLFQSAERGTCPGECVSNLVNQMIL